MSDLSLAAPGLRRRSAPLPLVRIDPARATGIVFVVLLHVALIYALVTTLAYRRVPIPPAPAQVRLIDEARPAETRHTPPPPRFEQPPPPYVPPPEIVIAGPRPTAATTAITATATKPVPVETPAAAPPPPAVKPSRVEPDLDTGASQPPDYPSMSRRMQEEGLVSLLVLVGPDGGVGDVKIEKSSGYPRLDQAAIEAAKSHSRFKPGAIDGKTTSMWYRYRYDFHLN